VATFQVEGRDLCLHLSWVEKLEAAHGNVRVPLATIASVRAVDNAWPELRGIRAPGTGVPGVLAVCTRRGSFGKDFAAVHGKGPAVVVELEGAPFARLIATTPDADNMAAMIRGSSPR
jgi:hypothetical protein